MFRAAEVSAIHGKKYSKATIKQIIQQFDDSGHTGHSSRAGTLWIIVNHCEAQRIPYRLTAYPGQGYYIERMPPIEEAINPQPSQEQIDAASAAIYTTKWGHAPDWNKVDTTYRRQLQEQGLAAINAAGRVAHTMGIPS